MVKSSNYTKLEAYYTRQDTLRIFAKASYEAYINAQQAYDEHTKRLTVLYAGSRTQTYLDGKDITKKD